MGSNIGAASSTPSSENAREATEDSGERATARRRARRRPAKELQAWQRGIWREPSAGVALASLLIGAPLLLGGVPGWAIVTISAFSFLCLGLVAFQAPARNEQLPLLMGIFCLVAIWTALQALPLPCGLVSLIAPESVAQARAAARAVGPGTAYSCTISRAPGATQQEILKGLASLSAFCAAWLFAASGGRRFIFWCVAWSSLTMAVIALIHAALGLQKVFGLYRPLYGEHQLMLAPLLNTNNLAGFVALGAPLWIGLSYRDPNLNQRLFGYTAIALISIATLLTMSRGGIAQLVAGLGFMLWIALTQRGKALRADSRTLRRLGLVAAIALGLGGGLYLAGEQLTREFQSGDFSKLSLVAEAANMALHSPLLGIGRGAFSSVFVGEGAQTLRFVYPENFVVHWLSEWGFPVTVALLVALGYALFRALRNSASFAKLGALCALGGIMAQNLVDFGFEQIGIAVVVAALLAACVAPTAGDKTDGVPVALRVGPLATCILVLAMACLAGIGPVLPSRQIRAFETALRADTVRGDREAFQRTLARGVTLYPSEPLLALLAAAESLRFHDAKTGRWLNRAMQLAPGWAAPHHLAFQFFWQRGRVEQALLELRLAATVDPMLVQENACRIGLVKPAWAIAAAPRGKTRKLYLELVARCIYGHDPRVSELDEVLLREFPESELGHERSAWRLHLRGETEESLAMIEDLVRLNPMFTRIHVMRARILLATGRERELIGMADSVLPRLPFQERAELLGLYAQAAAQIGSEDMALAALRDLRRTVGTDVNGLAESYAAEGRVQLQLSNAGAAFAAFREAYRINQDTRHLGEVARLAESLRDRPQALWAYIQLCQREPRSGGCAKRDQLLGTATQPAR